MLKNSLNYLIDLLFDFSYEADSDDAVVFYFFNIVFGFSILLTLFSLILLVEKLLPAPSPSDSTAILDYIASIPFILALLYYPIIAISIVVRKRLKKLSSVNFILLTIILTLYIPLILSKDTGSLVFVAWSFPALFLGSVPVTMLKMEEDFSLIKEVQEVEKEKLEHERLVERQLLTERIARFKQEQLKNETNISDINGYDYDKE